MGGLHLLNSSQSIVLFNHFLTAGVNLREKIIVQCFQGEVLLSHSENNNSGAIVSGPLGSAGGDGWTPA